MNYQIKWKTNGTIITFNGDVNIQDIDQLKDELHGDTRFYERAYSICDFRNCDGSKIDKKDLLFTIGRTIGASVTLKSFKLALVATDIYSRQLCHNFIDGNEKLDSPWSFRLFDTVDAAESWCKGD